MLRASICLVVPYIFQRPFLRGLFLEGPIFGGAYLRSEICVSKSIWLALYLEGNLPFFFFFFFTVFALLCFWGQFPSTSPQGAYIWRGDLTEVFLRYRFGGGGLIIGGAHTWWRLFSEFYGISWSIKCDSNTTFVCFCFSVYHPIAWLAKIRWYT